MFKKTLQLKLKNTPRNTPLVPCSVNSVLNRDESLSVRNKVLDCNIPEVDLLQHTGDQNLRVSDNMYVFVLNKRKEPLMPTTCRKARLLLKSGKAKIIRRKPFTIQLTYVTGENKQEITCGVDSGSTHVGFSCLTDKKELISVEIELDNFTSKRLTEKRMYRRNRRNRLRYREPRFSNKKKEEGWLPPSTKRKYESHIKVINKLKEILPISHVKVEVGNFDIQKLNNPEITNEEYQKGNLYEYNNLKAYIITREQGKCQLCKQEMKGKMQLHHIIPKSQGGTDKSDNIAFLHENCHKKLHKLGLYNQLQKNRQYKESTFMNIIQKRFKEEYDICYGYETFAKRNELNIEKSHANDAFIIAGGSNQTRSIKYEIKQRRKNNRSIQLNRKGYKPSIRRNRSKYQPGDLVKIGKELFEVVGSHSYGKSIIIKNKNKKKDISSKKILWHLKNKTLFF